MMASASNLLNLAQNCILLVSLISIVCDFQVNSLSENKIASLVADAHYYGPPRTTRSSSSNTNSNIPVLNRPGCHKLGHTREISIAGCVKFNLSTNACRGYCMSYSIPATEEHYLLTENSLLGTGMGFTQFPYEITTTQEGSEMNNNLNLNNNNNNQQELEQDGFQQAAHKSKKKSQQTVFANQQEISHSNNNKQSNINNHQTARQPSAWQQITTYMASTLAPLTSNNNYYDQSNHQQANGDPEPTSSSMMTTMPSSTSSQQLQLSNGVDPLRRDVLSVSQCCNMMETEDVIVNLRCGVNEIKRLVFKSAKTCECFFCKHV